MPEGVEFDEDKNNVLYSRIEPSSQTPKLIEWLLKTGVMKDQKKITYVLLGIAIVAFVLALFILFGGLGRAGVPPPDALMDSERGYTPTDT